MNAFPNHDLCSELRAPHMGDCYVHNNSKTQNMHDNSPNTLNNIHQPLGKDDTVTKT